MENTELKKLLESYNQDPKLKDLFNRSYGSSQDITTAIEVVERYKANVAGSKVEPKESLLKRIVKEPIEALVVRPVARTTEALGRTGLFGETIKRGYEEMADTGQQLDTIVGKYNIAGVKTGMEAVKQIGGEALESASYLPFTRMAGGALQATKGGVTSNIMKTLGREGAFGAGAYTLGKQLQEGEVNPAEIAKNIVLGYAGGSLLGLGGNIAGRSVRYLRKGATTAGKRLREVVNKTSSGGLTSNPKRNIRNMIQEVAEERAIRTRLATQPKAIKVFEETGGDNFIKAIENTASDLDLKAKAKILEKAEQRILGTAGDDLPRIVIAEDYIAPRVKAIQNRASEVGAKIGSYAEKTDVVKTDAILDTIIQEADKAGVTIKFNNKTKQFTITPKAGIAGVDTQKINTFENILKGFGKNEERTVGQLHASRKNLSDLTKRTDSAQELFSSGGAVDNIRRKISETIGDEYLSLTREYSDLVRTLKGVDPKFSQRLDDEVLQELKNLKNSEIARRVLSNASANTRAMLESLDNLYNKEMLRIGKAVENQNLLDLVDFAGAIEEGFGIAPRNSLFGQTAGAGANALLNVPQGVQHAVFKIFSKPTLNKREAIKAMREYLEEYITKRGVITPSQVIKKAQGTPAIRYSKKGFENTDSFRGGTWYATPESKEYDFSKDFGKQLGGNVKTEANLSIKNPLTIENADIDIGSGAVINEGYENYLPSKERELANRLMDARYEDHTSGEFDRIIRDVLNDNDNTTKQINDVLKSTNKVDAATDLIVSKGLQKEGYDALILKSDKDTHIFRFNNSDIKTKSQLTDI